MKSVQILTHEVAVNAYLINNNSFLLLKRNTSSFTWGPPGGRLMELEDPIEGLKREVYEETGQLPEVLEPVTTWFGQFNGRLLLSIDYLCQTGKPAIQLSSEHLAYQWLTISTLRRDEQIYFNTPSGFQLADYEKAWLRYKSLFP